MKKIFTVCLLALACSVAVSKPKTEPPKPTYAVWKIDNEEYLEGANTERIRPIASMTKMMTALVVLRSGIDLREIVTITGPEGSRYIRPGMKMSREQLIELTLVSSDNLASRTLAETYPGGYNQFISDMNTTASMLGMASTHYEDSTGLTPKNVSTPSDLKTLALATKPWGVFTLAANTSRFITDATVTVKNTLRNVSINSGNTNRQMIGVVDIVGAKTGFTSAAGHCLTMLYNSNGSQYLLVVMGSKSRNELYNLVKQIVDRTK